MNPRRKAPQSYELKIPVCCHGRVRGCTTSSERKVMDAVAVPAAVAAATAAAGLPFFNWVNNEFRKEF